MEGDREGEWGSTCSREVFLGREIGGVSLKMGSDVVVVADGSPALLLVLAVGWGGGGNSGTWSTASCCFFCSSEEENVLLMMFRVLGTGLGLAVLVADPERGREGEEEEGREGTTGADWEGRGG